MSWVSVFHRNFSDYEGYVLSRADLLSLIEAYMLETHSHYVVRRCRDSYNIKEEDINYESIKIVMQDMKASYESVQPHIPDDGIPFIHLGASKWECHRGVQRHKTKTKRKLCQEDESPNEKKITFSKKLDCPSMIRIRRIIKFAGYKFDTIEVKDIEEITTLHEELCDKNSRGFVEMENRYYVQLPLNSSHENHIVGEGVDIHMDIDKRISAFIKKKVLRENISSSQEMLTLVNEHVRHTLFKDKRLPAVSNIRYWPTLKQVQNQMLLSNMKRREVALDQIELEKKVEKWRRENVENTIELRLKPDKKTIIPIFVDHFTSIYNTQPINTSNTHNIPYTTNASSTQIIPHNTTNTSTNQIIPHNTTDASSTQIIPHITTNTSTNPNISQPTNNHDLPQPSNTSTNIKKKFLFIQQTCWQRKLLYLYGDDISILYLHRATNFSLWLFCLVVPTNCIYAVVASFIVESCTKADIEEALSILRSWNPTWSPKVIMYDFSTPEIAAIESVFKDSQSELFICDFQRLQNWKRFLVDNFSKASDSQDQLMNLLRNICECRNSADYQESLQIIRESEVFKSNLCVQRWFEKWIGVSTRWVKVYRQDRFLYVDTNSGMERLSNIIDYMLPNDASLTVTDVATVVIDKFLPFILSTYSQINCKWSSESLNSGCLSFLQNRPQPFVEHVSAVWQESHTMVNRMFVQSDTLGTFHVVNSSSSHSHEVKLDNGYGMPSCSCYEWRMSHFPCKHMLAGIMAGAFSWKDLPNAYTSNPLLMLDYSFASIASNDDHLDAINGECQVLDEFRSHLKKLESLSTFPHLPSDLENFPRFNSILKQMAEEISNVFGVEVTHVDAESSDQGALQRTGFKRDANTMEIEVVKEEMHSRRLANAELNQNDAGKNHDRNFYSTLFNI